jgi:hypothetical protein
MQSLQRLCGQIKSSIDQANRLLRALSSLSLHALPITYHLSPITHYPLPITHYPLPITHYPLPITDICIPPALDARRSLLDSV